MHNHPTCSAALLALLATALAPPAHTQCNNSWHTAVPNSGTDGTVFASVRWDPDGAGPQTPVIVFGGDFELVGDIVARNIAAYDPATGEWSGFPPPPSGTFGSAVHALTVLQTGELVVGSGTYPDPSRSVCLYDGTAWTDLNVQGGAAFALHVTANGDLLAGGAFRHANGNSVPKVIRWDGTSWTPLGASIGTGTIFDTDVVFAIAEMPNGDIVVGGNFTLAGGAPATSFAKWDGSNWTNLGFGAATRVRELQVMPNGDLVAGGVLVPPGSSTTHHAMRWDGTTWHDMPGLNHLIWGFDLTAGGELLAGGVFSVNNVPQSRVAKWNGTNWSAVGDGLGFWVATVTALPNGDIFAGGQFAATTGAENVAMWRGASWDPLSVGTAQVTDDVRAFATLPDNTFYMGGDFTSIGSTQVERVAYYDGVAWHALGAGAVGVNDSVHALAALANGDLIVAGAFTTAGGIAAQGVARWDGSNWHAMPGWLPDTPRALLELQNGNVVAGGTYAQLWNGQTWVRLGTNVFDTRALAQLPNGDLVSASFSSQGVWRWDGVAWTPLPSSPGFVRDLAVMPNGDLLAGSPGTMSRWNGVSWSPQLPPPHPWSTECLEVLPNGDILAGPETGSHLYRWDGSQWHFSWSTLSYSRIYDLESLPNGDVLVGAGWPNVIWGGDYAALRLSTDCPATTTTIGNGCTGSGGPNELTARNLPWLGSTFVADAFGMPPISVAVSVHGNQTTSVPLPAILPQGVPGCELLVAPNILDAQFPIAGHASVALPIPSDPALVGQTHLLQVAAFGADSQLQITEVTSTNALELVIGAF